MTAARLRLLGLGGWKENGKTAAALLLAERHGWTVIEMSAPIAAVAARLNPLVPEGDRALMRRYAEVVAEYGLTAAKENPEVRRLLDEIGAGLRDLIDAEVWTTAASAAIAAALAAGASVVVTGIRYPRELAMIRELGGLAAWVRRPGRGPGGAADRALREADFDATLVNDGGLDLLAARVAALADTAR